MSVFSFKDITTFQIGMSGWLTGEYSWKCQPVDYSTKPSTLRVSSTLFPFIQFTIHFVLDGACVMVVLLFQIHGVYGYCKFYCCNANFVGFCVIYVVVIVDLLCAEEEE